MISIILMILFGVKVRKLLVKSLFKQKGLSKLDSPFQLF